MLAKSIPGLLIAGAGTNIAAGFEALVDRTQKGPIHRKMEHGPGICHPLLAMGD